MRLTDSQMYALRAIYGENWHKMKGATLAAAIRDVRSHGTVRLSSLKRKKNPSRAERRIASQKSAAKRRVAVALAAYLKRQNPGAKLAGAKVEKLKGGVIKITPIKANRGR